MERPGSDEKDSSVWAIRRILITAGWFGGLVAFLVWACAGGSAALGFAGGALIGVINLILLTALIREVVTLEKRSAGRIAALLAIKLPVVYGGLAALILWRMTPTLAVAGGFSLVLVIIVLKAAGRALLATGLFGHAGRG